MSDMKRVNKSILLENGTWVVETTLVPYTQVELEKIQKEEYKMEMNGVLTYLEETKWIYDKQKDLQLTDEELYAKHGDIIDERILKRSRLQELQSLLNLTS